MESVFFKLLLANFNGVEGIAIIVLCVVLWQIYKFFHRWLKDIEAKLANQETKINTKIKEKFDDFKDHINDRFASFEKTQLQHDKELFELARGSKK